MQACISCVCVCVDVDVRNVRWIKWSLSSIRFEQLHPIAFHHILPLQKNTKYTSVAAKVNSYNKTVDVSELPPNDATKIFSNGTHNLTTVSETVYEASDTVPSGTTVDPKGGMNVLGLVVFSIVFGVILGRLGQRGAPLKAFFETLNEVIMKMVGLVMW